MSRLNFGDVVLLKFPFTNRKKFKRRPALIINDFDDGDIIVCRITSQLYKTKHDVEIDNWEASGLKLPSVIRVHKLATLEKGMVELIMGKIDNEKKKKDCCYNLIFNRKVHKECTQSTRRVIVFFAIYHNPLGMIKNHTLKQQPCGATAHSTKES